MKQKKTNKGVTDSNNNDPKKNAQSGNLREKESKGPDKQFTVPENFSWGEGRFGGGGGDLTLFDICRAEEGKKNIRLGDGSNCWLQTGESTDHGETKIFRNT